METAFYIVFTLKTGRGSENFARFSIGTNRKKANSIFQLLKGATEIAETDILNIEFIESKEGLPLNVKVLACTLDQLAENCKIVTKELFKQYNVEAH